MKLIHIKPSTNPKKKYMAVFENNGRTKTIHFGAAGMSDFTMHKDEDRKQRYISRHQAREDWTRPDTAGSLARWILWNKPTYAASVADYRHRFSL